MELRPARLPRFPSRSLEFLFSLKRTSRLFAHYRKAVRDSSWKDCAVLIPSAAEFEGFFFFLSFIIHSLPSPFRPSPAPSFPPPRPHPARMPEESYLPHSSLRRFPDQVQLLPASPSPPSSRNGHSKSGYQRPPSASLSEQLRENPIPSETQASRETGFPSCFSFTVFL